MDMNEFLDRAPAAEPEVPAAEELDVQKAVVESLAADKAVQDERIIALQKENYLLKSEVSGLKSSLDEAKVALARVGDVLAANAETEASNKIALIDRDPELDDRFPGETRDHVLEVIREARDAAEKDGRIRRAQVLESVLVANEPVGKLAEKRTELEKFFNDNANVMSGPVIAQLEKLGISHKNGEDYLLPGEILKRTY
ncbi:MAG: hypothetical protein KBT68_04820 [bacterium]|nr:hypothetical protein [Candidatus Colisoma equi]